MHLQLAEGTHQVARCLVPIVLSCAQGLGVAAPNGVGLLGENSGGHVVFLKAQVKGTWQQPPGKSEETGTAVALYVLRTIIMGGVDALKRSQMAHSGSGLNQINLNGTYMASLAEYLLWVGRDVRRDLANGGFICQKERPTFRAQPMPETEIAHRWLEQCVVPASARQFWLLNQASQLQVLHGILSPMRVQAVQRIQ